MLTSKDEYMVRWIEIFNSHLDGKTVSSIARHFGCTRPVCYNAIKRIRAAIENRGRTDLTGKDKKDVEAINRIGWEPILLSIS